MEESKMGGWGEGKEEVEGIVGGVGRIERGEFVGETERSEGGGELFSFGGGGSGN